MVLVDETFEIYVQMRGSGKQAKAVLDALRARIELMQPGERADLVQRVKVWEEEHRAARNADAQSTQHVPAVKPIVSSTKTEGGKQVPCPRCGKLNRAGEVFCIHCGNFLSTSSSPHETTRFAEPDLQAMSPDFFGDDSTLVLLVVSDNTTYSVRPQQFRHETVIGRSEGSTMKPDIDLSAHNASEMGVSRLHVALQYNAKNNLLSVSDMKSANGTFINGQKLFPQEVRVLRDGDEIRVGRLVLRAYFQHPTE
jgi:hypothetical protein